MTAYAELATRSNFSFLEGASHPKHLVLSAILRGHTGLGLADRNTLAGVVRAWSALRDFREEGWAPEKKREGGGPGEFVWVEDPEFQHIDREMVKARANAFKLILGARLRFHDGTPDILAYPDTMIGSDGIPSDETPHPRLWGTFPRVLGLYARDLGLFPLERAVHKMTGLPAQRFGLERRGELRTGYVADMTVFDPATIQDRATFDDPQQPSVGVRHVFVAGEATLRDGQPASSRPGRFVTSTLVKTQG